jgi:hypothetical protein
VQPPWIRGLLVDDYVSVLRPENYEAVTRTSWQMIADRIGPTFLHTCGPVLKWAGMLRRLPGLAGMETAFVHGFSKTTSELEELKRALRGTVVLQSFELPHGEIVHDEESLTAEWLRRMSENGGFIMQGSGPAKRGRELFRLLGLSP